MKKRFALHPGYITSKHDGREHYISAGQLARLYELRPSEWFIWQPHDWNSDRDRFGNFREDYIHLYPNRNGGYDRPQRKGIASDATL